MHDGLKCPQETFNDIVVILQNFVPSGSREIFTNKIGENHDNAIVGVALANILSYQSSNLNVLGAIQPRFGFCVYAPNATPISPQTAYLGLVFCGTYQKHNKHLFLPSFLGITSPVCSSN